MRLGDARMGAGPDGVPLGRRHCAPGRLVFRLGSFGRVLGLVVGALALGGSVTAQTPLHDGAPICGTEKGAGAAAPDDGVLRVATYNILHTRGDYDDETLSRRLELVADELASTGADVAGLQEVVRSGRHGMAAQRIASGLADRTGDSWRWCFFQSNPHLPGEPDTAPGGVGGPISQQIAAVARAGDAPWAEGVAIVARFPISDPRSHRLPDRILESPFCQVASPDDPLAIPTCALDTRQVLSGRVQTSCGAVDVFTTHLANTASAVTEQVRLRQVTDALAHIGRVAAPDDTPDVLTGDFNTLERGPVWQAVVDAGFVDGFRAAAPDDPGLTSGQQIDAPGPTVTRRIDYVFVRPGREPATPSAAEVLGDQPVPFRGAGGQEVVWPSDHFGVALSLPFAEPCVAGAGATPDPTGPVLPATH